MVDLDAKEVNLLQRIVVKELQDVNRQIAERTGQDPDVVDSQWFEDKQRSREVLVDIERELTRESKSLKGQR